MKYYKISEDKLKEFLETSLEIWMLDQQWYGASRRDILKEFVPDADEETRLSDIAEMLLKDYEVINE